MLKEKVIAASIWSLLDVFWRQGLLFLVTLFLARLLAPSDFGAVALIAVIAGFAGIFVDGGFSFALIQRKDVDRDDESSVFWFNLAIAVVLFLALLVAAHPIALYLESPVVEQLVLPFAACIVLNAASSVQLALLIKALAFKKLATVNAVAGAVSSALAVGLALEGFGVWALAAQALSTAAITTVALWCISGWQPRMVFRYRSLVKLFRFGSFMFMSALLDKTAYGLQNILIGKLYGVHDVGYYSKAESTLNVPQSLVGTVVTRILFPLFSAIADDRDRMLRGLRQAMRIAMVINAPLMVGLMVTSDVTVRVLLGENWDTSAPLLSVLCLVGLLWPVHTIGLNVLSGLGRSDLFFMVEIFKKIAAVAFVVMACRFGLVWIAWAQVLLVVLSCTLTMYLSRKLLGYRLRNQLMDISPPVFTALGVGAIVWAASSAIVQPALVKLCILVLLGAVTYLLASWALRLTAFAEVLKLVPLKRP